MKTVKPAARRGTGVAKAAAKANRVLAWENDPFEQAVPTTPPSLATPIPRPVPTLGGAGPLAVTIVIDTSKPPPAAQYRRGTQEFR